MESMDNQIETKLCECGCGTIIPKYDKRGRERNYVFGHWARNRTDMCKENNPFYGKHHTKDKIIIEVYYSYYKKKVFGSVENYIKKRSEHFAKYGFKTIFIDENDIENINWKNICLEKINNGK